MMAIQFNDLRFKQRDNKSLIVEMVVETQEVFTMSPEQFRTFHASMDSLLSIQ